MPATENQIFMLVQLLKEKRAYTENQAQRRKLRQMAIIYDKLLTKGINKMIDDLKQEAIEWKIKN